MNWSTFTASCLVVALLAFGTAQAEAACADALAHFDAALGTGTLEGMRDAEYALSGDASCKAEDADTQSRMQAFEIKLVIDPATREDVRADALGDVQANGRRWQDAATLGDWLFAQHRLAQAAALYDRAIALAGQANVADTDRGTLVAKAGAVKMLASNDDEGRKAVAFLPATRGPHGAVAGVYSPSLRGLARVAVPLPINFESGTAEFTSVGEKTATELAQALIEQKPTEITLIGHTDPRGTEAYNMRLSEERGRRVAQFIQQELDKSGVSIAIHVVAKGKAEPFDLSVLPYHPAEEEVWALDRRVEFMR